MQLFWTTLCVGLGGGIGAMLRYHITLAANRFLGLTFPFGTLIVNLLGGFAIGFLLALAQSAAWLDTDHRAFLITGLLDFQSPSAPNPSPSSPALNPGWAF